MKIKRLNQHGAFLVIFALVLLVILGFTALGIEAGRWYLVRAELSKSVDSAALVAAKNISNPTVDAKALATEFAYENFYAGYIGTPGSGTGHVQFNATPIGSDTFQVTGNVNAPVGLARLFGINQVAVVAVAAAQEATKKQAEIMMVLDRTGSMQGRKIADLQNAAKSFVDNFDKTQDQDKMGLISFSTDVRVDFSLDKDFVSTIKDKITKLSAAGGTNMEDAIDQAGGPGGLQDQSGLPNSKKVQQYVVFFSDGMPTAFRYTFMNQGTVYDTVATNVAYADTAKNCRPQYAWEKADMDVWFMSPIVPAYSEGAQMGPLGSGLTRYTGDGQPQGQSKCDSVIRADTVKWNIFSTGYGPVPGFAVDACNIDHVDLALYTCATARQMTLDKAQKLKDKGIKIYVIGLGTDMDIDKAFLTQISSGENYTYTTDNSGELAGIFNKIAKEIKLRLVQ
jgi:uncharacterized protein YegL